MILTHVRKQHVFPHRGLASMGDAPAGQLLHPLALRRHHVREGVRKLLVEGQPELVAALRVGHADLPRAVGVVPRTRCLGALTASSSKTNCCVSQSEWASSIALKPCTTRVCE